MEFTDSNARSTLYIEVNRCGHIPSSSWSVVFLYQFCTCSTYNVVKVNTQMSCIPCRKTVDNANNSCHRMSLPQSMASSSSVLTWSELPEIVQSCALPAIVDAKELVCYTGLCTVLRRLVMSADAQEPSRNLISLLGFRQTCLKTCSEVSLWTKLCEVQAPADMASLLQGSSTNETQVLHVPEAVSILETSLSEPVTTFNAGYRQQKLKKSGLGNENTDNKSASLKPAYKNAVIITDKRKYKQWVHSGRPPDGNEDDLAKLRDLRGDGMVKKAGHSTQVGDDLSIPIARLNLSEGSESNDIKNVCSENRTTLNMDDQSSCNKACRQSSDDASNSKLGQNSDPINAGEHVERETTSRKNDTSETKPKKKKARSKQSADSCSLPTLERTFAEGPDLTLTDVALLPYIQFFVTYANERGCRDVLRTIPFVLRWCRNMLDVSDIVENSVECKLPTFTAEILDDLGIDELMSVAMANKEQSSQEAEFGKGKSRKALKAAVKRELPGVLENFQRQSLEVKFEDKLVNTELDWGSFPMEVNPCQDVDEKRARNKRNQVESLVAGVRMLANGQCRIVDFCSGGGHVGIVLAYLLPECHVVMIENNEESLRRAVERVTSLGLQNVTLYQSNIDYFNGKFDIGVSLHACGVATDLVLAKCLHHQAAFVSSPCCYGGLQDTHLITYPRSHQYQSAGVTSDALFRVGHGAEQTSWNFDTEHSKRGKLCMGIIDHDRALLAQEQGYHVSLCSLRPFTCSPKNNLLIGWHKQSDISL